MTAPAAGPLFGRINLTRLIDRVKESSTFLAECLECCALHRCNPRSRSILLLLPRAAIHRLPMLQDNRKFLEREARACGLHSIRIEVEK